ncbi:MAG: response regulator [Clostridiaceae bacterium]|nr:response regulator [Clostridiaceae bacterium]
MYRVLLVDDEQLVVDSLKFILEKEYGSSCQIETAKSGREAIQKSEILHPDIILMDISMPGINGIEAIRSIREFLPAAVIILLTAYDKFDYAKQAISLSVFDYLMKPVNRARIIQTVDSAIVQVDEYRQRRYDDLAMREKLENVIGVLETGFVYALLFPDSGQQDIARYLEMLEIQGAHGLVMTLEFGEDSENGMMQNRIGSHVRLHRSYQTLRELIKSVHACLIGPLLLNRMVVFFPAEPEMLSSLQQQADMLGRMIIEKIKNRLDVEVRAGISNPCETADDLHHAWQESLQAMQLAAPGQVMLYSRLAELPSSGRDIETIEREYFESVASADPGMACMLFDSIYDNLVDLPTEQLKSRIMVLMALTEREAQRRHNGSSNSFNYCKLLEADHADDFREMAHTRIQQTCELISGMRNRNVNDLVMQAKEYLDTNFSDSSISLESAATKISLSPQYLSRIFSAQMGRTFIDYLTDIRIKKAKDLLRGTDLSVKEISLKLGYSDPNYFSRIFKRITGRTPSDFR